MKKWSFGIISCVLALTGVGMASPAHFVDAQASFEQQNETTSKEISNAGDLAGVINRTFTNDIYELTADIDGTGFLGEVFNDYGADKYFTGTFDGKGHTIKNLTLTSNSGFYGLFPYAKNATIKNLKIEGFEIDFDETYTSSIYAGLLVGYGENVVFENCEIILKNGGVTQTIALTNVKNETSQKTLNGGITFGLLGGKIVGNGGLPSGKANISNCIIEGGVKLEQTGDFLVNVGLMIGMLKNGFISHSICSGKIEYNGEGILAKNVGGVVGKAEGNDTKIRNVCFDGTISGDSFSALSKGFIVGGKDAEGFLSDENFNYCYWTATNYYGIGGSTYSKPTFINVERINQAFFENKNNFDQNLAKWDFEKTWSAKNGELRLQHFLTFTFSLNATADDNGAFDIRISNPATTSSYVEAGYNQDVTFQLNIQDNMKNWCKLNSVRVKDAPLSSSLYTVEEVKEGDTINSYNVTVKANALTEGGYSFTAEKLTYKASFEGVADDGSTSGFGGIKLGDALSTSLSLSHEFTNKSQSKDVEAKAEGKFVFKEWKLYYKVGIDDWEEQTGGAFQNMKNLSRISINYKPNSNEVFSREFKLVALFTKDAKTITLSGFEKSHVKSITVNGEEFGESGIEVATSATNVVIEVITKSSIINNIDKFVQDFNNSFAKNGEVAIEKIGEQKNEELEEINYTFKLNVSNIKFDNLEDGKTISINFTTQKIRMGASKSLLWLYILLPALFVGIVVAVIIIVVKKKSGKGRKQKGIKKVKEAKKSSYRDYYI